MFLFKRKAIELIAYTDDPSLAELFPAVKAIKSMPDYYKKMPSKNLKEPHLLHKIDNTLNYEANIKTCYGINQFHITGYLLPLWADYSILSNDQQVSCVGAGNSTCEIHGAKQSKNVLDNFHTIKLASPWLFACKENINFIGIQNFYASNSVDWNVAPGMYNFTYQRQSHLFLLVNKNTNKEIFLRAGTPLLKLIPITDRNVELKIEVVDSLKKYELAPKKFYLKNGLNLIRKRIKGHNNVT
jgi:hypothetical protein